MTLSLVNSVAALYESGAVWRAEKSRLPIHQQTIIPFWNNKIKDQIPYRGFISGTVHQAISQDEIPPLSFAAHLGKQSIIKDNKTVLWIGQNVWPTPQFLCEVDSSGALFQKSLFITAPSEKKLLWAVQEAALSTAVGLTIVTIQKPTSMLLKQFSVKLKNHGGTLLLLQSKHSAAPKAAVCSVWEFFSHETHLQYYRGAGVSLGRWSRDEFNISPTLESSILPPESFEAMLEQNTLRVQQRG